MPEEKPVTGPQLRPASPEQADALHKYAHDLKNRLSGLLEVVRQLKESGDQLELLEFGEKQAFAMLRRTEQMLDDLGVPRGPGSPVLARMDLTAIVRNAVDNQSYRYKNKQQRVVPLPDAEAWCLADPRHVLSAVEALLSNASKFSQAGGTVHLGLSSDQGNAVLAVTDNGVGLTAEDLDNIFSRYAWLSSRSTGGESQGRSSLAVCKRTVEAMGGTLSAHSEGPGKGSTFTLALPLKH